MNETSTTTLQLCKERIIQLKQMIMRHSGNLMDYEIQTLYVAIIRDLRALVLIDENENVRFTGVIEVDYLLQGVQELRRNNGADFEFEHLADLSKLPSWIRNHCIPMFVRTVNINGFPKEMMFYSATNFIDHIKYLLDSPGYETYEAAAHLLEEFKVFAGMNGLLDALEENLNLEIEWFVPIYKMVSEHIKVNGEYDNVFHSIATYLGVEEQVNKNALNKEVLFFKHFRRFESMLLIRKMSENNEHLSTPEYYVQLLLSAKNETEVLRVAKWMYHLFYEIRAVKNSVYNEDAGFSYKLTYTPFDQLAFVAIEENLYGRNAFCEDESFGIVPKAERHAYTISFEGMDNREEPKINLISLKEKLRQVFLI